MWIHVKTKSIQCIFLKCLLNILYFTIALLPQHLSFIFTFWRNWILCQLDICICLIAFFLMSFFLFSCSFCLVICLCLDPDSSSSCVCVTMGGGLHFPWHQVRANTWVGGSHLVVLRLVHGFRCHQVFMEMVHSLPSFQANNNLIVLSSGDDNCLD